MKGFDELESKLDALGKVGDKVEKTATKEGAKVVLDHFKNNAPADSGKSRKALKVTSTKKFKSGTWSRVGINASNWEKCKGLYFQHYGYTHWKSGKQVNTNVGWMTKEFSKVEDKARNVIIREAQKELDKIL